MQWSWHRVFHWRALWMVFTIKTRKAFFGWSSRAAHDAGMVLDGCVAPFQEGDPRSGRPTRSPNSIWSQGGGWMWWGQPIETTGFSHTNHQRFLLHIRGFSYCTLFSVSLQPTLISANERDDQGQVYLATSRTTNLFSFIARVRHFEKPPRRGCRPPSCTRWKRIWRNRSPRMWQQPRR